MGMRELVALFCLSSWFLVIVVWLFLTMPGVCLQFVIVVFPDHTRLLFSLVAPHVSLNSLLASLRYEKVNILDPEQFYMLALTKRT